MGTLVHALLFMCILHISLTYSLRVSNVVQLAGHSRRIAFVGTRESRGNQTYDVFKGIPYAEPPINNLRWKAPVAKQFPSNINTFHATEFGAPCIQSETAWYGKDKASNCSENCLFLNIWRPTSLPSNASLPVLIFIHGGGWTQGWSHCPLYLGNSFYQSSKEPIIFVSLNYRLGALGFWNGNWGLLDQVEAIKWVVTNIAQFDGDPNRISLQGQSAGGWSVAIHMTQPTLKSVSNSIQSVILQSCPFGMKLRTVKETESINMQLVHKLNCKSISDLSCMLNKSGKEVLEAQYQVHLPIEPVWPLDLLKELMIWQPQIDQQLILNQPIEYLEQQNQLALPQLKQVILSYVKNESSSFVFGSIRNPISTVLYEMMITGLFGIDAPKVLHNYPPTHSHDERIILSRLASDLSFNCGIRKSAQLLVSKFKIPTFVFGFFYSPINDPMNLNTTFCKTDSVCHSAELAYVFNSATWDEVPFANGFEKQVAISMSSMWSHALHGSMKQMGWNPFTLDEESILVVDEKGFSVQSFGQKDACAALHF